ncbi:MAG: pyridoxal phosphate-dependent aminotransferase [Ignavibacteria bacterium]|nr:pyridoxal phosphate-dependent aminotransferase [Ignavibacteria bacterium]
MSVQRLKGLPGLSIDRVAAAAGDDPEVLRLENLDTDLPAPTAALAATHAAIGRDDTNSYLPFTGTVELRSAVAQHLYKQCGIQYDRENQVLITCGGTEGMLDALLATTDPGDEVILTDPTYAGMIYRVRLAGAIPKLVPFLVSNNEWRLDLEALCSLVSSRTRVVFVMNPSMPSGAVLNKNEWNAIAAICQEHSAWLLYNAAMERILFDGRPYIHPASIPGMAERTITIGSVSKEYRMIGWRIGWVVGPAAIMSDIARVHIYNVVTPTGISQSAARAALESPPEDLATCVSEWQRRRDMVIDQLRGLPLIPPSGGWSLLFDVRMMGYDSFTASRLLLERGKVAATPMRDWGEKNSDRFVRLVFSNEPVVRLAELRKRVDRALVRK